MMYDFNNSSPLPGTLPKSTILPEHHGRFRHDLGGEASRWPRLVLQSWIPLSQSYPTPSSILPAQADPDIYMIPIF